MDLSAMQKYRIFRNIILLVLITVSLGISQSEKLYQLYVDNHIDQLENLIGQGTIQDPNWQQFTRALFIEKIEEALAEYIAIYNKTNDALLKKLILDRISQYYYAKGLYDSANRILKDENFRKKIFSLNIKRIYFGVQLGAFSSKNNAIRGLNNYSNLEHEVSIIKKESGGKVLYVLVAGEFKSKDEAQRFRDQLKSNYGYKGIIVQY